MKRVVAPFSLLSLAAGCVEEEQPRLLLPHGIEVAWEETYNPEGDGLGALVPVDVMVYDGGTGEALSSVPLEVWTEHDGAWPVPGEGVVLADPDLEPAFWDASSDQFVRLELADDPLGLVTDSSGLARAYVYVDSFGAMLPDSGGAATAAPIVVFVSMDGGVPGAVETIVLHSW